MAVGDKIFLAKKSDVDSIQAQVDELVVKAGDSSAEVLQARVDAGGKKYTTLQQRLNASDALSAQKAKQEQADNIQAQVSALVLGAVGAGNNAEVIQSRVNKKGYIFGTVKEHADFEEGRLDYGKLITLSTSLYSGVQNGGTVSGNVLTIPAGSLGGNSYIGYIFGIKKELSNKTIIIELNLDHSANMTNYEGRFSGATGISVELNKNNLNKLFMKLTIGELAADTSVRLFAYCINYTTPLAEAGTITLLGYQAYRYDKLGELKDDIAVDIKILNQSVNDINIRLNSSDFIIDKRTLNLFDKSKYNPNGYYNASGSFANDGSYLNDSGPINVEANKTYYLNRLASSQPIWNFFRADGTWVSSKTNVGYSVTVPNDPAIKIMRAGILKTEIETAMITEGVPTYGTYYPYNSPMNYPKTDWYGKKSATIGDSLTQAGYWQPALANVLGLNNTIIAQSGGNMTAIAGFVNQLATDINLLIVWAGTNDWFNNIALGTLLSSDTNTYYGALKYVAEYCSTNFPHMKVIFITPMQRYSSDISAWATDSKGYHINPTTSKTLEDYANAVTETGKIYGIPVLDMYHESGVNKLNIASYSDDKLHPTRAGFEKLVWKIIEKIKAA